MTIVLQPLHVDDYDYIDDNDHDHDNHEATSIANTDANCDTIQY